MRDKEKYVYMKMAYCVSKLSHCYKRQVGCVILTKTNNIVIGYNGTPSGNCNCCEDEFGNTKPNVIHAEDNAIRKLKQKPKELEGSSLFVTYGPCISCIQKCIKFKIKEVYYGIFPTKQEEIDFLKQSGIETHYLPLK